MHWRLQFVMRVFANNVYSCKCLDVIYFLETTMTQSTQKQTKLTITEKPALARKRVQKRRATLKAMGLRPIEIWIPDTRKKGFAEECRRQSLLIKNNKKNEEAILTWLASASEDLLKGW